MLKQFILVLVFLTPYFSAQSQEVKQAKISSFVNLNIKNSFKFFNVSLLDVPVQSQIIMGKMDKAIFLNQKWFEKYLSTNKNKKIIDGLPYHKNFGITKEEYEKLKLLHLRRARLSKEIYYIKVHKENDNIVINSVARNPVFNIIKIDLSTLRVSLDNWELSTSSFEIDSTIETPAGRLFGYSWSFEECKKTSDTSQVAALNSTRIYLDICKSISTGKVLFRISKRQILNGIRKLNDDWLCQLN